MRNTCPRSVPTLHRYIRGSRLLTDNTSGRCDESIPALVGFAGALRRFELAGIKVEHLEECQRGWHLILLRCKGDHHEKGATMPLPCGVTKNWPVRAPRCRQHRVQAGAPAHLADANPLPDAWPDPELSGWNVAIQPITIAGIVQSRATTAAFDAA